MRRPSRSILHRAVCLGLVILPQMRAQAAMSSPLISGRIASVTDGDTFRLTSGERIRIADIDAPESRRDQAKCPAELALGKAASKRARALLIGQDISFIRRGKSWKRTVAIVNWRGRNLGKTLIANGIARPWPRYGPKPDWCH